MSVPAVRVCYQQFAVLVQQSVVLHRQILRLFLHGTDVTLRLLQSCETQICSSFRPAQHPQVIVRACAHAHTQPKAMENLDLELLFVIVLLFSSCLGENTFFFFYGSCQNLNDCVFNTSLFMGQYGRELVSTHSHRVSAMNDGKLSFLG